MSLIKLRDYQEVAFEEIRALYAQKILQVLFVLPTGGGKCLGAGTPVLMYDGTIKSVEDVRVGDRLMGPDSQPRCVLSLARGSEPMYRVTPVKGDPYVVNESHILSLKRTASKADPVYPSQFGGKVVNVGVKDYLSSSANFKHTHKGWRAAVDFEPYAEDPALEPYFLGLWLGDGHSNIAKITTGDEEILDYLIKYAARVGMKIGWRDNSENSIVVEMQGAKLTGRGGTRIMNSLRRLELIRNKHIPHRFKTGSRQERLDLLAGLIDTDGHHTGKGYDIVLGCERLMDDMIFVARSLGFSAYKSSCRKKCHNNGVTGSYWRCSISGDIDDIPCLIARKKAAPRRQKKSVLVTGIRVDPIGIGEYFGFEIDGDHLFMLGDFTVTHNTYTFSAIADAAASRGRPVCIIVHRKELLLQASASLSALGIHHGLISPDYSPTHALVQVASVDTLQIRLKKHKYKFGLLIFDEAHHVIAGNKWGRIYESLGQPPMLGVTATPVRTDGKGLGTIAGGLFSAMVLGPSVPDLVKRGMLIAPTVYMGQEIPDFSGVKVNRDGDLSMEDLAERIDKPKVIGDAVKAYTDICAGARAIVFCPNVNSARHVMESFNAAGYRFELLVGAPAMSDAARTSVNKRLRSGELHGACTVDLVSEGYDLPDLTCCIMLRLTQSEGLFLQQVGRVMRPSPGKTECFLLDHVGNIGRPDPDTGEFKVKHGFPHWERDWTLDGKKKKRGRAALDEPPPLPLKQCPKCYIVHEPMPVCLGCGFEYPAHVRSIETVEGIMVKVSDEDILRQRNIARAAQAEAVTVEEMMSQLGYPRKRADAIFRARAEKHELREGLTADLMAWRQATGQSSHDLFGVPMYDIKRLKPKELKDLRARFDAHRQTYESAQRGIFDLPGDDPDFGKYLRETLNPQR
jgi:superfamily II DNA or RNA helicase